MIKCPNCGKQNQDHYKFCLGCGSELPRDVSRAAAPTTTPTPPSGIPVSGVGKVPLPLKVEPRAIPVKPASVPPRVEPKVGRKVAEQPAAPPPAAAAKPVSVPPAVPAPAPAPAPVPEKKAQKCPACGADIPPDFTFCGRCGTRIGAAPAVKAVPKPEVAVRGKIVMIQPSGAEGVSIPLTDAGTEIGRLTGEAFKDDYFLSPRHAKLYLEGSKLFVQDLGSLNGIYIRLAPEQPYEIQAGDFMRVGQEVIRFDIFEEPKRDETPTFGSPRKEAWGKISLILGKDKCGNAFNLEDNEVLVGRERGNIIFPDDGYVSGLHLKITKEGEKYFVSDLKSSNGSYVKIREKKEVKGGDYLLVGQFLYRVDY